MEKVAKIKHSFQVRLICSPVTINTLSYDRTIHIMETPKSAYSIKWLGHY